MIWEAEQDNSLIIGVYLYGNGNWDAIRNDDRLQLHDKMLLESDQKPQTRQIAARVEYILRLLDIEVNPKKNGGSPGKGNEKSGERKAKKEKKDSLKREKKEREAAESAAKKRKVFKSREEVMRHL